MVERAVDAPHASYCVLHLNLSKCFVCVALDFLQQLSLCRYDFSERGLEVGLASGRVGSR